MAMPLAALSVTTASLSFLSGSSSALTRVACAPAARRPTAMRSSFFSSHSAAGQTSSSLSFLAASSFAGLSLGFDWGFCRGPTRRYRSLQVRAGKAALCMTKRSRSRKSLARTHGFRRRMRTTGGWEILRRRRAKGRKVLCTKSNPSSGKRA